MSKKILYLEDEVFLHDWIVDELNNYAPLTKAGYDVASCYRIDQAKEYFIEYQNDIKLIITDLNMDDRWLEEYSIESYGGFLSGAVWLERFVYTTNPDMPTIVFSAYCDLFAREKPDLFTKKNIDYVNKGMVVNMGIIELLNKINNQLNLDEGI